MEENNDAALQSNDYAGSGSRALAGYDYQVDVSIWLALDLMLGNNLTQVIELEPGTEEDIEAQLKDDEPGRVVTRVDLDGYTLVVQVKLRGGDAWTVNGFISLLKHGSEKRLSAVKRLEQPEVRYLLVTSAALNGKTRDLEVKRPGSWPTGNNMPASVVNALPAGAAGRVAIIGNLDEERLVDEIKRYLIERFGIPNAHWAACLRALRDQAWMRVRHVGGGRWSRDDLAEVIRSHDGYLASSPLLEDYVHPLNWPDLRSAIGKPKYAAILIGQSGTGKTLATDMLYEELRQEIPGLKRVRITHGPQQLRNDTTLPPVLYDIEDPWGRFAFDPSSRPWNDKLAECLSQARADKMVIATSRKDVALHSDAMKNVESWIVPLEAENYGKSERQQLYRSRIKTLPRDIQPLATKSEEVVLSKLATPLEIEKFFDALRTMDQQKIKKGMDFINYAVARSHETSIENTVVQQIEQRDDVRAAAVIWAFLKVNNPLSLHVLRDLEFELASHHSSLENGVTPLIDFFIAARNLRSGKGNVSYYHPRVEAGVEHAIKRHAVPVTMTLRALLEALTDPNTDPGGRGAEFATRIAAAAKSIQEIRLKPAPKTAAQIDSWLSEKLLDPSCNLNEYLRLAGAAGSDKCNGAEFARYLLHRPERGFAGLMMWGRPEHPDAWYERMRADADIAIIAGRFIREVLYDDHIQYGKPFVDDLERLAPDLTEDYINAAKNIIHLGYIDSAEIIAAGALRDIDGFEPVVDKAVQELTQTSEQKERESEIHLKIGNEVYNDDYAQHLSENDDGYTASVFLQAYVDSLRVNRGWMSLVNHRHASKLVPYWMHSLIHSTKTAPPSNAEMAGAFEAAYGGTEEYALWTVLRRHWDNHYRERLITRVKEGCLQDKVRCAALECLLTNEPNVLSGIVNDLLLFDCSERAVEIMIDLAHIQNLWLYNRVEHDPETFPSPKGLCPALLELFTVASKSSKKASISLSADAVSLLARSNPVSPGVRRLRISLSTELSTSVRPDIELTLAHSDDRDACVEAIETAISSGYEDIVEKSLEHRFSHVVAKALASVGERVVGVLPANLLALVNAEGSPVRKALVSLLADNVQYEHLPVLSQLAQDQWSSSSQNYGDNDDFPIARMAVQTIGKLSGILQEDLKQLLVIALKTSDHQVRLKLFIIIAKHSDLAMHERLLELAVTPGRKEISFVAAHAMLMEAEALDHLVVSKITPDYLLTLDPSIASRLTLIVAFRLSYPQQLQIARKISEKSNRRALLLLMLYPYAGDSELHESDIAKLLPCDHPSLKWLEAGPTECAGDDLIADLGEPDICREILFFLNPREE